MIVASGSVLIAALCFLVINPPGLARLACSVDYMETFRAFALECVEVISVVGGACRADSVDHEVVEVASA